MGKPLRGAVNAADLFVCPVTIPLVFHVTNPSDISITIAHPQSC